MALHFHRGAFLEEGCNNISKGKEKISKRAITYVEELESVKAEYAFFEFPRDLKK